MSANLQTHSFTKSAQTGGGVWYRLHSEREEICEALLREPWPSQQRRAVVGDTRAADQLEKRLRLINDALDRIMGHSYGNCIKCGGRIDDAKLDSDPASEFCNQCGADDLLTAH